MSQRNFGTAVGDGFILNEATLMLGELGQAEDLTEEEHSIGLFKNLAIANERSFQSLTQGVRQDSVHEQMITDNWTISGNGYEYNPRTLMYSLGQNGMQADPLAPTVKLVATAAAAVDAVEITVESAVGISAGDFVTLQSGTSAQDGLVYRVVSTATNKITLDRALVTAVAVGDVLVKTTLITSNDATNCSGVTFFSAKVTSVDVNCKPITILIPKVQITSGLNLNFGSSDYANIAFQLSAKASHRKDASYDLYKRYNESKVILFT